MSQTPDIFPGEFLNKLHWSRRSGDGGHLHNVATGKSPPAISLRGESPLSALIRCTNIYRGRKVSSYKPLFTSYVFRTELSRREPETNRSPESSVHDPDSPSATWRN